MKIITITGNLTRDPVIKSTPQGRNLCDFTVAVNEKDSAMYFDITAWGSLGEICAKYLKKGQKVAVHGSFGLSVYTGKDGQQKTNLRINANTVEFLSKPAEKDLTDEAKRAMEMSDLDISDIPY